MREIKKLFILVFVFFASLSLCYAAEVTMSWDYDHTIENQEDTKFRIYGKKVADTEYTTISFDSKDDVNPQVHQATVITENGEDYNFIARAYNEAEVDGELTVIESEDSNEVTYNAPEFIINGLEVASYPDSEKYENPVYFGTTDKDITISWTALSGASYEFRLWDVNRKVYALSGVSVDASETIRLPKTGCYELEVRAKIDANYTDWKKLDSRIIGWVAGVGPIVIGN